MSAQLLPAVAAFTAGAALVSGRVSPTCRACVIVPVCNEETTLCTCLDAFALQEDLQGRPLPAGSFELLLLLNNCTDRSLEVAREWLAHHPGLPLHVLECTLPPAQAHAGTARKLLMDTAWHRLQGARKQPSAILSTDADSIVAPDWIAQNLRALEQGADAVGGLIAVHANDLATIPAQVRRCYERDRRYAELTAELEHLLDPQPGDAWPRHLDHFGSSLACTPEAYAAAGGMPAISPLEDEAFVDCLRRANLCLRHEPKVRIFTSARLQGRAEVGLAGQLRLWSELSGDAAHCVRSAELLAHRFRTLRTLRDLFHTGRQRASLCIDEEYMEWVNTCLRSAKDLPTFFREIHCDGLIAVSFQGKREQPIVEALRDLGTLIAQIRNSA